MRVAEDLQGRLTKQTRTYTYPQPTISKSASTPGSIFGRRGGSDLNRRRQRAIAAQAAKAAKVVFLALSKPALYGLNSVLDALIELRIVLRLSLRAVIPGVRWQRSALFAGTSVGRR